MESSGRACEGGGVRKGRQRGQGHRAARQRAKLPAAAQPRREVASRGCSGPGIVRHVRLGSRDGGVEMNERECSVSQPASCACPWSLVRADRVFAISAWLTGTPEKVRRCRPPFRRCRLWALQAGGRGLGAVEAKKAERFRRLLWELQLSVVLLLLGRSRKTMGFCGRSSLDER